MSEHLNWVTHFEEGKYDLAILHVDQQCLLENLGKSKVFRQVYSVVKGKVPVIVINHGTPVYPEMFIQLAQMDGYRVTEEAAEEWARVKMRKLLDGVDEMVVNSHEAQKMWGWGQTIIHGLDPNEWWDLRKEPRVVTFISPAGIGDKYYGRRLFSDTRVLLKEEYGVESLWIGQDVFIRDWDDYRTFIGKSLVYFNPTIGSPMPRSRSEAMMSGCCVVTTPYQDADTFIQDGVNGFLCKNNPEDAAKKIADMIFNYQEAIKIGKKGRETAIKLFNKERYQREWLELISKVTSKNIC